MTTTLSLAEAKNNFSKLVQDATTKGITYIITRYNEPTVKISPVRPLEKSNKRPIGLHYNGPLSEEEITEIDKPVNGWSEEHRQAFKLGEEFK